MTTIVSSRVAIYGVVAIAGVAGGLGLGRPEIVAIGLGAFVVLALGLLRTGDPGLTIEVRLDRDRAIEGEDVFLDVSVSSADRIERLEMNLTLPPELELRGAVDKSDGTSLLLEANTLAIRVPPGEVMHLTLVIRCGHWGGYLVGKIRVVTESLLGLHRSETALNAAAPLKVFPPEKALRELLEPVETQLNLGELVSRRTGDGIEFAELRPYAPGDDPRRINWRASIRRASPWMNDRHPERNSDIVLIIDTLTGRSSEGAELLDHAVRAAASISSTHLGRRDRVGLLVMGGPLLWLRPGMFDLQRHTILDVLADSRLRAAHAQRAAAIPPRSVPPKALLIALTPLLDEEATDVLVDLVGRGYDVAIIEVAIDATLPTPDAPGDALARRIWELQRDAVRRRFRRAGVALVRWELHTAFEDALREVAAFRRAIRRARI